MPDGITKMQCVYQFNNKQYNFRRENDFTNSFEVQSITDGKTSQQAKRK